MNECITVSESSRIKRKAEIAGVRKMHYIEKRRKSSASEVKNEAICVYGTERVLILRSRGKSVRKISGVFLHPLKRRERFLAVKGVRLFIYNDRK